MRLKLDLEPVTGSNDFQHIIVWICIAANFLVPQRVSQDRVNSGVIVDGLMMKRCKALYVRTLTKLNANNVGGVAPIFFQGNRIRQGIHGVKHNEVSFTEKLDEAVSRVFILNPVFGIARIHEDGPFGLNPVSIGITCMKLQFRRDLGTCNLCGFARLKFAELDLGSQD